ncbi:MAG: acyl--CoA ligase [Pseudolabrys sp.]|nr:acyl--CoA ligase [Pseudolabrys sp.]
MILHSDPANDSRITLDDLFRRAAGKSPDAVALADPPNRPAFMHGVARTLTYAQLDRAISAFAARLRDLGLSTDSVVALQLPNVVESIVATLGVLRAGLIAMPLPLLWRAQDIGLALEATGVRMLITADRIGGENYSATALQAAAHLFSVRHIGVFGPTTIDGVIPLDDVFSSNATLTPVMRDGNPALHAAIMTCDTAPGGSRPAIRNHQQLMAAGLAVFLESGLADGAALVSAIPISSLAGLASTLLPWLLSGGSLALAYPFDPMAFVSQCTALTDATAVLPGPSAHRFAGFAGIASVIALWRQPERMADIAELPQMLHVISFREAGLIASKSASRVVPNGIVRAPRDSPAAIAVLEATRTAKGTLGLRGAMVPVESENEVSSALPDLFVDTGYPCRLDVETNTLVVTGPRPGLICVGGYFFSRSDLDTFAVKLGKDATLVALPDALLGYRLVGRTTDPAARAVLSEASINPLIADAFRPRTRAAV